MIPKDTDQEAYGVQVQLQRNLGGNGRVALAVSMSEQARAISRDGIRARHPEYSEDQVHHAFARLILGDALYEEVYPGLPRVLP